MRLQIKTTFILSLKTVYLCQIDKRSATFGRKECLAQGLTMHKQTEILTNKYTEL
jgi:hypothetical protein